MFDAISARLSEEVEISAALAAIAPLIAEVIPFTHADICLHDSPGWVVSYEAGIETRWSHRRTRVHYSPVRDLLQGRCELMISANAMEDPRYTFPGACCEPILNHRLRARINVPLRVMGKVTGTLNISHETEGFYDKGDAAWLQHLGNLLAPWFHALHAARKARQAAHFRAAAQDEAEGLRQGALELTQTLEQERQRIGMDLHDQTLADLTRILRDLTGDAPLDRDLLAERVTDTIDDLRALIDTAVPTLLDLFGYAHAVRVHLERAVGAEPVEVDVEDETDGAPDRLGSTARTALFRITQEAINNAARHSGARRILVSVSSEPSRRLRVTISDDGRGIGPEVGRRSGLSHLRTRAQLIGADLEIVADRGTRVTVTLPENEE
ncbi:ATP-binding protein [Alloyangia pacifica]|uniref:GAF domain-containing sensor histidine kinase n=1 Tax=Alloyangia pacifica TaxID=311180 RepID=UPI001CD7EAE2|nr:ATP-binding protein [Alloyangia pacifica]MCA0996830.1 sensor histidine kinase [Alloyangia pacifica]